MSPPGGSSGRRLDVTRLSHRQPRSVNAALDASRRRAVLVEVPGREDRWGANRKASSRRSARRLTPAAVRSAASLALALTGAAGAEGLPSHTPEGVAPAAAGQPTPTTPTPRGAGGRAPGGEE